VELVKLQGRAEALSQLEEEIEPARRSERRQTPEESDQRGKQANQQGSKDDQLEKLLPQQYSLV
jgi:hypothetical protein